MNPWLAALAIVLAYLCAAVLDGPTDHHTEVAQAQAIDDAHAAEAARLAQQARVQRVCGPNAAWTELTEGDVQCMNKHGRKTIVLRAAAPTIIAKVHP